MKKVLLLQTVVITIVALILMSALFGHPNQSLAAIVGAAQGNVSDEDRPPGAQQSGGSNDEVPPSAVPIASESANTEPTTQVYFAPQDNNFNATVVSLYNTTSVTHTVTVIGFRSNAAYSVYLNVDVGPSNLVHLVSDSLADPPPSWDGSVTTNFTDHTTYASLAVPQGIKFDGYIVFNPGGLIDPNDDQGAIPLRFSTDPLTVLLPAVQNGS